MKEKRWSKKHAKCISCGTKEIKHGGNGLCSRCYQRSEHKKEHVIKRRKECQSAYYQKNKDKLVKEAVKYIEKRKIYRKRVINALKKAGHSDKRIESFFGFRIFKK